MHDRGPQLSQHEKYGQLIIGRPREQSSVSMNRNVDGEQHKWIEPVVGSLKHGTNSKALADGANYSVAQFYRRFLRHTGSQPLKLRRRLLMERSAYELTRTKKQVTDIAFGARYESLEDFSRAFRAAFGVSPTQYRKLGATDYRLAPQSTVHYAPPIYPEEYRQGAMTLNILDRLFGAHYMNMKLILDRCETLTDEQLDSPIEGYFDQLPWMGQNPSIRTLLKETIGEGGPWPGIPSKTIHDTNTIAGLRGALEESYPQFMAMVAIHEKHNTWDLTFVDSDCEPPMVFSHGGWTGHVIVFQSYRRIALLHSLQKIGVDDVKYFDPIDFTGEY